MEHHVDIRDRIDDFHIFLKRDKTPTEHMLLQTICALSVLEPYRNKTPEDVWNEQRAMTFEWPDFKREEH